MNKNIQKKPNYQRVKNKGFTLIEIMIVVAIVAILSSIALPAYDKYVKKSRARGASADLVALSLALENRFQKSLVYPTLSDQNPVGHIDFNSWKPAQGDSFTYLINSTPNSYTIKAIAIDSKWACTLSLDQNNKRNAANDCVILGDW